LILSNLNYKLLVFKFAKNRQTPIVMLLSGGYQKSNALVIARSIENLKQKNLIGY